MRDIMGSITGMGKYLEGTNFPADKDEIINQLEENNAPDMVLSVAEKLPDKAYNSVNDVVDEIKSRF